MVQKIAILYSLLVLLDCLVSNYYVSVASFIPYYEVIEFRSNYLDEVHNSFLKLKTFAL
jgi:hypothetical protein